MAWLNVSYANVTPLVFGICHPCRIYGYCLQRMISQASDNYYDVLGLQRNASQSQIKSAYYRLSKLYHPDVATDAHNAKDKFANLTSAYEVLGNPHKRAQYDRSLPVNVTSSIRRDSNIDVEYREFLRRRGTFRSRVAEEPQAPASTRRPRFNQDDLYKQYYGSALKQNWQAQKAFHNQQKMPDETGNIKGSFMIIMCMGIGFALYFR